MTKDQTTRVKDRRSTFPRARSKPTIRSVRISETELNEWVADIAAIEKAAKSKRAYTKIFSTLLGMLGRGQFTGNQQEEVEIKAGMTGESQDLSRSPGSGPELGQNSIRCYPINERKDRWSSERIVFPETALYTMVL